MLHAEDRHLRDAERARVVHRVAGLQLGAQQRDGRGELYGLLGGDDPVVRNREQYLLELGDVRVLRGERMDEADERLRLVDVRLAVRKREFLGSRDKLRNSPFVRRL